MIIAFVPSEDNNYYNMHTIVVSFQGFIYYYTDQGHQVIGITIISLLWNFLPQYIIFKEAITAEQVFLKVMISLVLFCILSMFAMIFLYIATLH